jgi:beta-glucosidase
MTEKRKLRKAKGKTLRPWRGLTLICLLFALGFSVAAPVVHALDNDFMVFVPGSNWKMENPDPNAIYYPTAIPDEAEALAYGETVARRVSEEGIVLLTNEGDTLPLPEGSRLSLFSTSSARIQGSGLLPNSSDRCTIRRCLAASSIRR